MQHIKTPHGIAIFVACFVFVLFFINWVSKQIDFITLSVPSSTQTAAISGAGSGLVGYWTFDEGGGITASDTSGGGNNGTLVNGPTWATGTSVKIGSGALQLDGVNDYVITTKDATALTETTISLWVNPNAEALTTQKGIFQWANVLGDVSPFALIAYVKEGGQSLIKFAVDDVTSTVYAPLNNNTWTHVVLTLNSSNLWTAYLNGVSIGTYQDDATHGGQANAPFIYFGNGYNSYFDGKIDDARVYNRALTQSEITQLYNYTSGTLPPPATNQPPVVVAGNNQTITLPATANLTGTASDDGLPAGSSLTTTWSKVSGPGTVSFSNPSSLNTTATFSQAGTYVVRLSASDTALTSTSDVTITVNNLSAQDTIAPIISNIQPSVTSTGATITWDTDESADAQVEYGLTTAYGNPTAVSSSFVTSHSRSISNLTPNTTYHYRVKSKDAANNLTTSIDRTFLTNADITSFTPFSLLGLSQLKLTGPLNAISKWVPYSTSGDSPEGGWFAFFDPPQSSGASLSGTLELPLTLAPGKYYVFIRVIDYGGFTMSAKLGNTNYQNFAPKVNGWNGWSAAIPFDLIEQSNALTVKLVYPLSVSDRRQLFLRSVYITQNPNEYINDNNEIMGGVTVEPPTEQTTSKKNIIPGSSFETGIDASWGLLEGRTVSLQSLWDPSVGYDGTSSIKINNPCGGCNSTLISRLYDVKGNTPYSFSFWAKAESGKSSAINIKLMNPYVSSTGVQHTIQQTLTTNSTGQWQRYSISGTLLNQLTSDYHIYITPQNYIGNIWLDAMQLEEGDVTTYAPGHPVDAGITVSQPGNIFYEDESISGTLRFYNFDTSATTTSVQYEVYDYLNKKVKEGSVNANLSGGERKSQSLNLSTGLRGIFRLVYWIPNTESTEKELVYSVIPRVTVTGIDETSYMGTHPDFIDYELATMQKLGIKWARGLSPAKYFRWETAEPTNDQFVFFDSEVQKAANYGMTVIGNLTGGTVYTNDVKVTDFGPSWSDDVNGIPNLDEWEEYVRVMVDHYRTLGIRYWEIWNEPNHSESANPSFNENFYARLLMRSVQAIKSVESANPGYDAKIIAMGGTSLVYMQAVIAELEAISPGWWNANIDIASTHAYPAGHDPAAFESAIINNPTYGKPLWNTETGVWDNGFYMGNYSNFLVFGENLWPHQDAAVFYNAAIEKPQSLVENFIQSIGSGQTKYVYYDSRIFEYPSRYSTHPTILEYDDSIRPKGIAYAIAGHFLDRARSQGNLNANLSGTYSYLFERNGTPTLATWTTNNAPKFITTSLAASNYEVFDLMGNRITISGGNIPIGRSPIYIRGINSISLSAFKSAFQSASVTTRTDAIAPNVSVVAGPHDVSASRSLRMRWIALDDTSLPEVGVIDNPESFTAGTPNPSAILYSYRLVGLTNTWSLWTGKIYADFFNLSVGGQYTFEVKAKDEAGNISSTMNRTFSVGSISESPSPTSITPTASNITTNSAIISWTTNQASDTQINYGLTTAYGSETSINSSMVTSHTQTITNLQPNTVYNYRVLSKDAAGNLTSSSNQTFTTIAVLTNGTCGTNLNLCTTGTLNNIADTSTNYLWQCIGSGGGTSVQCSQEIPIATYSLTTSRAGTGGGTVTGTGINCGTDCAETLTSGTSITLVATPNSDSTFTGWTGACTGGGSCTITVTGNSSALATFILIPPVIADTTPPIISNLSLKLIAGKKIEVQWVTNELSDTQLEYGTTQSYGTTTPLISTPTALHKAYISDLVRGTTYHLRARSRDTSNNLAVSQNISFTAPLKPSTITGLVATAGSVILSWSNPDDTDYSEVIIYRGTVALTTPTGTPIATITDTATTSYKDTAVSPSTTYVYTIFTKDTDGTLSEPMSITFTTLAADAPIPQSSGGGGGGGGSIKPVISKPIPTPNVIVTGNSGPSSYDFGIVTLRDGSRGPAVMELQRFLNRFLNLGLVIDGVLGPKTIIVIKKWQSERGLVPDGLIGPKTKAIMNGLAAGNTTTSITPSTKYNLGTVTLRLWSRGEAVKELQRFLNDKLKLGLVLDGVLGPKTIIVIKKWQSERGLVPDGLIGPKTKAIMNGV